MTDHCWLLIQDVSNQRNSVDLVPVLDSKNLTVKWIVLYGIISKSNKIRVFKIVGFS